MAFVHTDLAEAHLLEVNDSVLVLLDLMQNGSNVGGKVRLAFDKTFEHPATDYVTLLFQHIEVLLNRVKLHQRICCRIFRSLGILVNLSSDLITGRSRCS